MKPVPHEFFVGLTDFFSILLPGALLSWLMMGEAGPVVLGQGYVALDKTAPEAAGPTHAGGVVFRLRGNAAEYLLVEATNDPTQWVLPRGHVEEGEQHRETTVREVYEETGVWARIVTDLGDVTWLVDRSAVTTRFFLMRATGSGLRQDKDRRHAWLRLPEAVAKRTTSRRANSCRPPSNATPGRPASRPPRVRPYPPRLSDPCLQRRQR
jgi:8-oxo-dGTP pyrophosphatase MutT (NUDIX family)